MRYISGEEEKQAKDFLYKAAEIAKQASCERSKCGSIIVKDGEIIASGFNSPPNDDESQRRCKNEKSIYHKKVTDKTCCVHAEQRAMMDALKNNSEKIVGASLYFIRLDENEEISFAGQAYCTICSKMALDLGIAEFVLWHETGICVYDTVEYNDLSFEFGKDL